jgi:hypothetical protein
LVGQIEVDEVRSAVIGLTDEHPNKHKQPKQYQQQKGQEH